MKLSEMLEEYLNHRDVVRHCFTSTHAAPWLDQQKFHKQRMEELSKLMDNCLREEYLNICGKRPLDHE